MRCFMLLLGLVLAALVPAGAAARPFTVDDLLSQEAFGAITLDPTGRYAAVERRGPYASGARFDLGHHNAEVGTKLLLADLRAPSAARPLMPQPEGYGYLLGPWSPDGRQLAVYRLGDETWELGLADIGSGQVRWLGVTPASVASGRSVQWRSPGELIVLAADAPPRELRSVSQSARRLPARWARSAQGRASYTLIGSGAWRELSPSPGLTRVLRIDANAGKVQVVASGRFARLELAPSDGIVALFERGARLQPNAERSPQGAWGVASEAYHLAMLDLRSGQITRPCAARDLLETLLSWSPSGGRLLVFARAVGEPWMNGRFHLIEASNGDCRRLNGAGFVPSWRWRPEAVEARWLGDQPIVRGRASPGEIRRADWWRLSQAAPKNLTAKLPQAPELLAIEGDHLIVLSGSRLWRVDPKRGAERLSGAGLELVTPAPSRQGVSFARDGAEVMLGDASRRLHSLEGPTGLQLDQREAVAAFSRAEQALLVVCSTPQGVLSLESRKTGGAVVLSRANEAFEDIDPVRVRSIRHVGADGQPLTSWLYLPAPSATKPALIVRPYLGDNYKAAPQARGPVLGLVADVRVLVGEGYAVLLPSLPLSRQDHAPLQNLAARVLGVVDAASRQAPGAFDPARIAIWGHSYGGYAAMGVIGQTDRFKAAITMNAPMDLISIYGTFQPSWRVSPEDGVWPSWTAGWAEDSQGRMGAAPWLTPSRYIESSPLFRAQAIHTPVMIVHADQDPVPLAQAEEMFSALYRQNKDAVIITYWGEGHIISSPANVRDLYARAFGWLSCYLEPAPQSCRRPAPDASGT